MIAFGVKPPGGRELLAAADAGEQLFLPRIEPGWIGSALAVLGLVIGVWWARRDPRGLDATPGWVALALIAAGMVLQFTRRRIDTGWRVDFAQRRIEPVGIDGSALTLEGDGWVIVCTEGRRKRSVAIDLRHAERGRVARLFETAGRAGLAEHRALSALSDRLAQRLKTARDGLTI